MGPVLGRLFSNIRMRAFAFVLLAAAAVTADSDPYTIGQVASGLTHGGVVTGVDYSNGVVSGIGAIGNRAYAGHVGYAGVGHLGYSNHVVAAPAAYSGVVAAPSVYSSVVPTTAIHGYAGHYYGKRDADSDADAYTIGQVAAGLPVHNAYVTGHPHNVGVVTGTTYSAPVHHGYTSYAAPAYTHAAYGYSGVHAYATPAIHGYSGHYYGKREADSDADAYTIGQVAAGLPVHNAYATPAYTGYAGHLGYAGLGYAGLGYTGAYYG